MTNAPIDKVTLHDNAADVEPSNRGTIYRLDSDGVTFYVTVKDALSVVNAAMLTVTEGLRFVEEMISSHGNHRIRYTGGTEVHLFEIPAPKPEAAPADWGCTFTANRAHRFDLSTHKALCHKGITSYETRNPGDRYALREDYLSPLWDLCPRCDAK